MATQFLDLCAKLQVSVPARVPELVRGSFKLLQQENVIFLALGYDYWVNPSDLKAGGLYQAFLMDQGASASADDLPQLNFSAKTKSQISSFWFSPTVSVKRELIGDAVTEAEQAQGLGDTANLKMRRSGGVMDGAAGNYNLVTKALDVIAEDFGSSGLAADLQRKLPTAAGSVDATKRGLMVAAYKELRNWWGDSDLTRIGLTPR